MQRLQQERAVGAAATGGGGLGLTKETPAYGLSLVSPSVEVYYASLMSLGLLRCSGRETNFLAAALTK